MTPVEGVSRADSGHAQLALVDGRCRVELQGLVCVVDVDLELQGVLADVQLAQGALSNARDTLDPSGWATERYVRS